MPSPDTRALAGDALHERWQRLYLQIRKTLRNPDVPAIHDLRVSIRRLVQALISFEARFAPAEVRNLRRRCKTLLSAAGRVRDCDIAAEWMGQSGGKDLAAIGDELHARRKGAERALASALRRWLRARVKLRIAEPAAAVAGGAPEDHARKQTNRRAKAFFQYGNQAVEQKLAAADLHKLRIAAKKFRYTFEIFQPSFGPTAESRLEQIRQVQSALGDINDLRTVRKLVSSLGGGKKLDAALRKKQRKKIAEFRSLWQTQFPPSEIKEWMRFLRQPPRKPVASAASSSADAPVATESARASAR